MLNLPLGFRLTVVIVDNNPESQQEAYIGRLMRLLSVRSIYAHEPKTGYSSARNRAIEAGLTTETDLLAFVDDDFELDPDWVIGHIRSYAEFNADCILGKIDGLSLKYRHGDERPKCGIGNTSFRRMWVDASGLALRFDPRFDKTGGEDYAFTSEAVKRGQKIVYSEYPLAIDRSYDTEQARVSEEQNKALVFAANAQNRVALARQDKGRLTALMYAVTEMRHLVKAARSLIRGTGFAIRGDYKTACQHKEAARIQTRRTLGAFRGLSGKVVERQCVRRSK